jgi:hypothetical protein
MPFACILLLRDPSRGLNQGCGSGSRGKKMKKKLHFLVHFCNFITKKFVVDPDPIWIRVLVGSGSGSVLSTSETLKNTTCAEEIKNLNLFKKLN